MANRPKMDRSDRAKQFMPFDAVKGLHEALREKERIVVPRMELAEDYAEELNRIIQNLSIAEMITVVHFEDAEYVKTTGLISKIDKENGYMNVVNTRIEFKNIMKIEK